MADFIGIGAQKSGTSWLHYQLSSLAGIHFPGGKEVHFWDIHYGQGVEWYQQLFKSQSTMLQGDITPAYAIMPKEKIQQLYDLYPKVRLFFIMRNPVDRAWSAALMALSRAEMTIKEASDQWFIDHFNSQGSLMRGNYQQCLENWLSVFPKEQLLCLFYDDIIKNPLGMMDVLLKHINYQQDLPVAFEQQLCRQIFTGSGDEIRLDLKKYLQNLYAPSLQKLVLYNENKALIFSKDSCPQWLYP